ncbi:MAG TPA: 16S rRNA (cytosine(1402)-N(4))-methyltransferase RsmH [Gammaproteobacteria bacterium]
MVEHEPVLVAEVLAGLALTRDGWYVDATYGRGGHSTEILARLGDDGRVLALDKDPEAVADGRKRLGADARFQIVHAGFEDLGAVAGAWLGSRRAQGVLLDLGVSSPQLDTSERGFSFMRQGPLDMRMDSTTGMTAAEWLARTSEAELARVLRDYGEEPRARKLAAALVAARREKPIETTFELARLVAEVAPRSQARIHPATRVFQALRIAVNRELEALEKALAASVDILASGGRLAVISFHSLEDRIVKRFIAREARGDERYAGLPDVPADAAPRLTPIGRLVRPQAAETARNARARSARLRVAERLELRIAA